MQQNRHMTQRAEYHFSYIYCCISQINTLMMAYVILKLTPINNKAISKCWSVLSLYIPEINAIIGNQERLLMKNNKHSLFVMFNMCVCVRVCISVDILKFRLSILACRNYHLFFLMVISTIRNAHKHWFRKSKIVHLSE